MLMPIPDTTPFATLHGPAEIDLELFAFVERYATTLIRWDLVLLFGKNPDSEWTCIQVAEQLRRSVAAATKELDDLTYQRVLVRQYTPDRTTYRLTRRGAARQTAMRLAQLNEKPSLPSVA